MVASVFLFAFYQLYSVVINDAGASRNRAKASNAAYEQVRKAGYQTSRPCVAVASSNVSIPSDLSLPAPATMTSAIDCPYGASGVSRITVTVTYGSPRRQLNMSYSKTASQPGFTLVEMLVVAPIVILVVGELSHSL
ncbi:hypothetical protein IPF89_03250 [Candidatus Saccharibacteria bacterium]|nr:MAG: hypothetical protein IPF89_03250 [Candidatus Saccharibacteria bacterium]